jgi:methionyl-tRNA formyltransferase
MIVLVSNLSSLGVRTAKLLHESQLLEGIIWQKNVSRRSNLRRSVGWIRSWIRGRSSFSVKSLAVKYRIYQLRKAYPGRFVETVNINECERSAALLRKSDATIGLVIGGRILSAQTIEIFDGTWLNLHGGVLPRYRGLDSEFWATKECNFGEIGFTLHRLTEDIDLGEIIVVRSLQLDSINTTLKSVIRKNEDNGFQLMVNNIEMLRNFPGAFDSRSEVGETCHGKYFSSAPASANFRLKLTEICKDE